MKMDLNRLINALKARVRDYCSLNRALNLENEKHVQRHINLLGEMLYELEVDEDVVEERLCQFLEEVPITMMFDSAQFGIYSVVKQYKISKGKDKGKMVKAHFTQEGQMLEYAKDDKPKSYKVSRRINAVEFDVSIVEGLKGYELLATPI